MKDYLEHACEEIDASLFSGDSFENTETRKEFKEYLERWVRELNKIEKGE